MFSLLMRKIMPDEKIYECALEVRSCSQMENEKPGGHPGGQARLKTWVHLGTR